MAGLPKCPKCERSIDRVEIKETKLGDGINALYNGVSFVCPHCNSILSVSPDPYAIKAAIVEELKAALGVKPKTW